MTILFGKVLLKAYKAGNSDNTIDYLRYLLDQSPNQRLLLFWGGDATALALALSRVLDDEAWARELGKRAKSRAENYFSPLAIGKQLSDFLLSQRVHGNFDQA